MFISFIWILFVTHSDGAINVDELNFVTYHVDILNKPVMSSQESSPSIMYMTSKYGQEYQCQLPEVPQFQDDGKIIDDSSTVTSLSDISSLLKPLETRPCLIKTKDWWTYEFCYGKYIKQYHLEDNKIASPVILLGIYESEFNWKNETLEAENSKNRMQRYHSQYYVNGSKCDITGTLRKTEVRFVCDEGSGDYLAQVDEPESCRYIIMIHTNKVCKHPYLRPPPTNMPRPIMCHPILSSDQYQVFLKREEEEKKVMEERQKKWLAKQEEELLAFKQQQIEESAKSEASQTLETQPDLAKSEVEGEQKLAGAPDDVSVTDNFENDVTSRFPITDGERVKDDEADEIDDVDGDGEDGVDVEFSESSELSKLTQELKILEHDLENQLVEQMAKLNKNYEKDTVNVEPETFGKLAETLVNLLKQLDKAEKDLTTANEALWKLQKTILQHEDSQTRESGQDKSDEVVTQKSGLQMEPVIEEKEEKKQLQMSDALKQKVKKFAPEILRALKWKNKDTQKVVDGAEDSEQEIASDDENVASIEQEVMDRLKQMGIDTAGRKVEVKIITAGYFVDYDEYNLVNDGDTNQLQTVVVKLGGHNEATAKHIQHQNSLEKNYRFVWDESKPVADDSETENDNPKNS